MKVSEVIERLQKIQAKHGDISCWLQSDQEGNGYEELRGATFAYRGVDDWDDGYFYDTVKEALANGNKRESLVDCLILWP
jgi:DUF1680 family protein